MDKAYTKTYEQFQNAPSTITPISAEVMNDLCNAVDAIDDRVVEISNNLEYGTSDGGGAYLYRN